MSRRLLCSGMCICLLSACGTGGGEVAGLEGSPRARLSLLLAERPPDRDVSADRVATVAALRSDGGVTAVAAHDAASIAVVAYRRKLQVIDTVTSKVLREIPLGERHGNRSLSIFPNGRVGVLTYFGVRGMQFFDLKTGEILLERDSAMGPSEIVPGSQLVAYADADKLRLFDPVDGRDVSAPFPHGGETVRGIAVSPDGSRIATLTGAGTLHVWQIARLPGHESYVLTHARTAKTQFDRSRASALVFSRTGEHIWTLSSDVANATLTRWPVADLQRAETIVLGRVRNDMIRRLGHTGILVTSGSHAEQGSYLLFIDTEQRKAALVEAPRLYMPSIATVSDPSHVYWATVHELRKVAVPPATAFQHVDMVLAPLQPKPVAGSPPVKIPILADFPRDAAVEAVSVYEGGGAVREGVRTSSGMRVAHSVEILVGKTPRPLALVLGSYEPVVWSISASGEANLTDIFLAGHYESIVRGAGEARIHQLSVGFWHPVKDPMLKALDEQMYMQTGRRVDAWQGAYKGIRFYFGRGAPEPAKEPASSVSPQPKAHFRPSPSGAVADPDALECTQAGDGGAVCIQRRPGHLIIDSGSPPPTIRQSR